jgi:DNA-binding transcriptional regulator WhiA
MAGGKRWTAEEDLIITNNYIIKGVKEVERLLPHRTYYSIVRRAMLIGANDKGNYSHKTYSVDNLFFNTINNDSCYWAGFFAADATIYSNTNVLAIKLQARDIELLEELKRVTKFTGNIRVYDRYVDNQIRHTCSINICGVPEWVVNLKETFNVVSNKSLVLLPPLIDNKQYILCYLKGYIDGNGSISKNKNSIGLRISTSKYLANWIVDFITRHYNVNCNIYTRATKQVEDLYTISKGGKDILPLLIDINNCYSFGLKRKWQKLSPFIK